MIVLKVQGTIYCTSFRKLELLVTQRMSELRRSLKNDVHQVAYS